MEASSPYEMAPTTVRTPVNAQAASNQPALPSVRAISADTRKMPDPIIDPTTTIVESKRPRPRENSVSRRVAVEEEAEEVAEGSIVGIMTGWFSVPEYRAARGRRHARA